MTNTGDFRRYSYQSDASYALKAFDLNRSSAAPAYTPKKKNLKVRENDTRKSRTQLLREQRAAAFKVLSIGAVSLAAIAMLFGMLHTFAAKNELNHEIANLQSDMAVAQSENTRINSELNALVSMSMIDEYAVNNLGMTKVKSNQIRYIDVSQYKEERKAAALMLEDRIAGE
ncbi:MAG: septum formation initiator family protein [Clostridium sp.]|nr:septum formation initiator family protein [Clostridium sp.]